MLIQIPPTKIHKIFIAKERQPSDFSLTTVFFPKGNRESRASLNVCTPKGIPMIVMQSIRLDIAYSMATKIPPKINQRMLPSAFIVLVF
jgi:hypothetical protein